MSTPTEMAACPRCGSPSWNTGLNPGEPCFPCKREVSEPVTRVDTVSHRVGECPACQVPLFGKVTIESEMSEPRLGDDGRASVYASARPVAMYVEHECRSDEDFQPIAAQQDEASEEAAEYDRARGYDRPREERSAEARRMAEDAPVIPWPPAQQGEASEEATGDE